jgi:hypothetical protein
MRSRQGRLSYIRPIHPNRKPYPELSYLAHAVLAQAGKDATPECERGGEHPHGFSTAIRMRQFQALIWLCGSDPDLLYWLHLAAYPIHCLHHKFVPILYKLTVEHPALAQKFLLPPTIVQRVAETHPHRLSV